PGHTGTRACPLRCALPARTKDEIASGTRAIYCVAQQIRILLRNAFDPLADQELSVPAELLFDRILLLIRDRPVAADIFRPKLRDADRGVGNVVRYRLRRLRYHRNLAGRRTRCALRAA